MASCFYLRQLSWVSWVTQWSRSSLFCRDHSNSCSGIPSFWLNAHVQEHDSIQQPAQTGEGHDREYDFQRDVVIQHRPGPVHRGRSPLDDEHQHKEGHSPSGPCGSVALVTYCTYRIERVGYICNAFYSNRESLKFAVASFRDL